MQLTVLGRVKDAEGQYPSIIAESALSSDAAEQSGSQAEWAEERLAEARAMMDLPALAHGDAVLMQHTKLQNTFMCQPRNMYGRIFGGFLMRCGPPPMHVTHTPRSLTRSQLALLISCTPVSTYSFHALLQCFTSTTSQWKQSYVSIRS